MKKVETQDFASHEEGVQFSRVIIYMINSAILASHEGKSIYSSAYNCLLDCNGVDGRRKILRLYWADAVIKYWWKLHIIMRWQQK